MKSARAIAMDYLARREHARFELERKLGLKGFSSDEIADAIDELIADNLQSNERFTEQYITSHVHKGAGPMKITQGLLQCGIDECLIQRTMAAMEIDWHTRIHCVWQKKFTQPPATLSDKASQQRFLMQRGFELDQIQWLWRTLNEGAH